MLSLSVDSLGSSFIPLWRESRLAMQLSSKLGMFVFMGTLRLGTATAAMGSLWASRVLYFSGLNVADLEIEVLHLVVTVSGPKAGLFPASVDLVGSWTRDDVLGACFKSLGFRWEVLDLVAGFEASFPVF